MVEIKTMKANRTDMLLALQASLRFCPNGSKTAIQLKIEDLGGLVYFNLVTGDRVRLLFGIIAHRWVQI